MSSFSVVPISQRFGRDPFDWSTRAFFDDDPFMRMEESLLTGSYPRYYIVDREPASTRRPSNRELLTRQLSAVAPEVRTDSKNFHVLLDVAQFSPDEIEVKVSDNEHFVVITGKHETKDERGFSSSREFTRKYSLPTEIDPTSITCSLGQDGILTLKAPKKPSVVADKDRVIPLKITHVTSTEKN